MWKKNVVPFHIKTRSPTVPVIGYKIVIEELNISWPSDLEDIRTNSGYAPGCDFGQSGSLSSLMCKSEY